MYILPCNVMASGEDAMTSPDATHFEHKVLWKLS